MTEPLAPADIPAGSMEALKNELLELKRSGVGKEQGMAYAQAWMDGFSRPSLAGSFTQGLTFGYGDEIKGGLRALVGAGSGDRLTETARARGQLAASEQKNGWLATGAEIAGGIAPTVVGGGLAARALPAAASGLGRLAQGIAGGAAGGAATGAAYGSGNAIGGLDQRLEGGRNGALVGGMVGAVAAPAVQGVQAVARKVGSALTQSGAGRAAQRNIVGAMEDAGTNPADVAARVREANAAGVPMTLAEGIGQPGQDLIDYAVNTPGAGRNLAKPRIEQRQLGQPERLKQAVSQITGVDEGAATRALAAREARSATSGPLYDALNDIEAPEHVLTALRTQLRSQEWQAAYREAQASSRLSASVGDLPREMPSLDRFATEATNKASESLSAREVDLVLQAVQDRVKAGMTGGVLPGSMVQTGGPTGSRALNRTAEHISNMMKDAVPEFRDARQAYSTASAYLDGLEKGQSALAPKTTIDEFRQMFASASQDERRGLREGLVSAYKATLENFRRGPTADATKDALNKQAFREKFRVVLGSNEADRLLRQLEMENVTSQTANRIQGSATGFRGANKAAIEGEPLMQQGGWSLGGLAQRAFGKLDEATSQKLREQLARTGMTMDPAEVERLLQEAMTRNPRLIAGARTGALSGSTAALITERGR